MDWSGALNKANKRKDMKSLTWIWSLYLVINFECKHSELICLCCLTETLQSKLGMKMLVSTSHSCHNKGCLRSSLDSNHNIY